MGINRSEIFEIIKELEIALKKSDLPNPVIYLKNLKKFEDEELYVINVVIDETQNYVHFLNEFSEIIIGVYSKHNANFEIFLFDKGELTIPLEEQGYEKIEKVEKV